MSTTEKIGDVKYSILEPNIFGQVNGDEWVLMDGRSIEGSKLFNLTGMSNVPDARGVFIRNMNLDREATYGDADGNRTVGNYQKDQFESHNHDVNYNKVEYFFAASGMGLQSDKGQEAGRHDIGINISNRGGNETRPRNISLFLYIKIN